MAVCEMQSTETILSILKQKSEHDENYVFERVSRNLFNEDFFIRAYQKIYAKESNMTPGVDDNNIDGFSKKQITQLIELLKMERYQPKPVRRTYIPKKNRKMRPLGITDYNSIRESPSGTKTWPRTHSSLRLWKQACLKGLLR